MRAPIDTMCSPTIDCRYETSIDGRTRYQWPRIIAVHAPPRSSDEDRKLATVRKTSVGEPPFENSSPCMTTPMMPADAVATRMPVRNLVNMRPIVAQANTMRPVHISSGSADGAADTWSTRASGSFGNADATAARADWK